MSDGPETVKRAKAVAPAKAGKQPKARDLNLTGVGKPRLSAVAKAADRVIKQAKKETAP